MDPSIRIGDSERDTAVERLRAHHAEGRLDISEFDDRLEKALAARTAGDLLQIFKDLPDDPFDLPRDDRDVYAASDPMPYAQPPVPYAQPNPYAHLQPQPDIRQVSMNRSSGGSGMMTALIGVVFLLTFATGGRLAPLLIVVAVFVMIRQTSRRRQNAQPPQMFNYQAGDQQGELRALIRANRRIEAIKRYREMYGVGLMEAKQAIEAIERQDRGIGY